ncbi:sensor histidine kinase [Salinimonas lutimaris]|uniref:sensor histidine kinase n=1 Tax=Salinimonas lutimaris TaxID=914153 RepID=UPI0010BFB5CC|nr:sensor histidine kinase [Salinimonas lutimaris]
MVNTFECGCYLEASKTSVFNEWEALANRTLRASDNTPDLIVRNYLPYFLSSLTDTLKSYDRDGAGSELDKLSKLDFYAEYSSEHGRSRASVSDYTVGQVIEEYALLRQVLRNTLKEQNLLCLTSIEIIDRCIEASCAAASQQFANSLKEVQSKLISVIAHDLRNPISVARSYVEVGELELAPRRKVFGTLKRSLERALSLISELLDTAQLQAGQGMTFRFEQSDLVKELRAAITEAQDVYSNQIVFNCDLTQASLVCDPVSVLRVVENLISNGIKYGSVESPITVNLGYRQNDVQISVHNHGSYIEPKMQNSLFDFFSRSDNQRSQSKEGWGLGLYLVRLVAKAHDGKAWIESDRETGTTFFITLSDEAHPEGTAFSEFM